MSWSFDIPDAQLDALVDLVAARLGTPEAEAWMDVGDAAKHLACSPRRIYTLVSQGRIPHGRDGKRLLFRKSELDAWLERSRAVSECLPIPYGEPR